MKMPFKDVCINAALFFGSLIILMVVLETACRLTMGPAQRVDVRSSEGKPAAVLPAVSAKNHLDESFIVDTPTGLRLRKNFNVLIKNHRLSNLDVRISTNSLGFRYKELKEKAVNDFRILVLGDSITYGEYLPEEFTYPKLIERYLSQSQGPALQGKNVEVVNAGIGGVDLSNEYAILKESGLKADPDVVLVGLYLNDAIRSVSVRLIRTPKIFEGSYFLNFLVSRFDNIRKYFAYQKAGFRTNKTTAIMKRERRKFLKTRNVAANSEGWRADDGAFNRLIYENFDDAGFSWSWEYWEIIGGIVDLISLEAERNHFKVAFVLFPNKYQVQTVLSRREPQDFFEELMSEKGISHLDLLPYLRKKYEQDRSDIYYDQCHMNPEGSQFSAKIISEFLNKGLLGAKQ